MPGHSEEELDAPITRAKVPPTRPVDSTADAPPGAAAVAALQRLAGNRAVVGMLRGAGTVATPGPLSVQRDDGQSSAPPTIGLGRPRPGADGGNRLHLDPAIEAQIRAIQAMRTQLAPEQVKEQLVNLTLPQLPTELLTPPTPPGTPGRSPAPAAPPGPAPGTGLTGPRAGTGGDIWKAVLASPVLGPAVVNLGELATARAKLEYNNLSTGGKAAVVSTSVVVGVGALTAVLAHPGARDWMTATLNDKIIPVVPVPGLGVQLNLSGNTIIVGLHLDVGKILPASLGFGPASETAALGAPPPR